MSTHEAAGGVIGSIADSRGFSECPDDNSTFVDLVWTALE
jgi:hypothetical protein